MLKLTKTQIFTRVAATVNGEATAPATTDTEYTVWGELLEESNQEWARAYDFRILEKTFTATMPVSGTSVALPADYVKPLGFPEFDGQQFIEIKSEEEKLYTEKNYVIAKGNVADGFYMKTTPVKGTGGSYVAASIRYISSPTAMATGTSVSPISDPNFLVSRLKANILKQRGDPAFTLFDNEADLILKQLIEQEVAQFSQMDRSIKDLAFTTGFTIGVD